MMLTIRYCSIVGSEGLAAESALAEFSGIIYDADESRVFKSRRAYDSNTAYRGPAGVEASRCYNGTTPHIVRSVFASNQDCHVLASRSLYTLVQYLDNAVLLFENLEKHPHQFRVREIRFRDYGRRPFYENDRLVAFTQALTAQQHRILKQFVIQSFFLGHSPQQLLTNTDHRPTVEILYKIPCCRVKLLLAELGVDSYDLVLYSSSARHGYNQYS